MRQTSQTAARARLETMEPSTGLGLASPSGGKRKPAKARKFSLRRAGYALLIGICALAGIGVPMNALFFQDARHPAPMFLTNSSSPTPVTIPLSKPNAPHTAEVSTSPVEGPKPKAEGGHTAAKSDNSRNDSAPPLKINPRQAIKSQEAIKHDPIADLLNGPAKPKTPAQSDILMAQQALLKLGYVVRADGKFSKATQRAIEKFELDNGMPVKGALTTKIASMLASRAGLESE